LGDPHHLDTLAWKDIAAGLETFRSISKVTIGKGDMMAFWTYLWLGDNTLQDQFPNLFSHSTRTNVNVATALTSDLRGTLEPRLSQAAETDLRNLAIELSSVVLCDDVPDSRWDRFTTKSSRTKVSTPILSGICRLTRWRRKCEKALLPLSARSFAGLLQRGASPPMSAVSDTISAPLRRVFRALKMKIRTTFSYFAPCP
jgi:hypothetical protein